MLNFLYSIRSRHVADIMNLKKTYELRTRLPREMKEAIDRGEKVTLWGYCTMARPYLHQAEKWVLDEYPKTPKHLINNIHLGAGFEVINGLVVFKCVVDEYIKIGFDDDFGVYIRDTEHLYADVVKNACVTNVEFESYFYNKGGFALHLTQVEILDKPLPITAFQSYTCKKFKGEKVTITDDMPMSEKIELLKKTGGYRFESNPLTRAPQSYQRVLAPEGK